MAVVTCDRCGRENDSGEEHCEHCGLPLPRQVRSEGPARPVAPPVAPDEDGDPFAEASPMAAVRCPDGRTVSLQQGERLVLGRTPESPLADLCQDNVSFEHAELYVDGRTVVVVDIGSTNGTFVDGRRLARSVPEVLTESAEVRLASDPPLRLMIDVRVTP